MSRRRERGGRRDAGGTEGGRALSGGAEGGEARGASSTRRGVDRSRGAWAPAPPAPNRRPPAIPFLAQAGILVAVFALTTLIAEFAGAANLGVSFGIAAIAFSIALVLVIVRT
jgi:hypothetical protein